MSLYVIADLHLDTQSNQKSMEVFGNRWRDYVQKIRNNWSRLVGPQDTVVIPGDISWGLNLEAAIPDLKWIDSLPGRKILLKGNHDFWWSTLSKMQSAFCENCINTIDILYNNAIEVESFILAGSRGWFTDRGMQSASQDVDYEKIIHREVVRLELSLKEAEVLREKTGKEILLFLHFPPIWGDFRCEEILALLRQYKIQKCFFGHIHSNYSLSQSFEEDGIVFRLISADYLDFIPYFIG